MIKIYISPQTTKSLNEFEINCILLPHNKIFCAQPREANTLHDHKK